MCIDTEPKICMMLEATDRHTKNHMVTHRRRGGVAYSFGLLAKPFFGKCFCFSLLLTDFKSFHFTFNKLSRVHESLLIRGTNLCQKYITKWIVKPRITKVHFRGDVIHSESVRLHQSLKLNRQNRS